MSRNGISLSEWCAHSASYEAAARETEIENSGRGPFTRSVFVIARYHEVLRRLGLDTLEGVKHFRGELIKNHKGRRDIQRIIWPAAAGISSGSLPEKLTLFLKRNWKPYKKDGLKCLLTRGEACSQSRIEWENSQSLQRAGLAVAEPIAFGEECGLFWERFSFVLTKAAPGETTLDEFLRNNRNLDERREVFDALAGEVRKLHDAGLASPDLFTRHIFLERGTHSSPAVQNGTTQPKFCLIDMARLNRRRNLSPRFRARDLAALNVTAPLRFVSTRERLRFLKIYGGDRRLRGLIVDRTRHLLKRRKFGDFFADQAVDAALAESSPTR